jgi:predicted Zn-dependent protease
LGLYAKEDTQMCYSIQLLSSVKNEQTIQKFSNKSYPGACKFMDINNIIAVRCECLKSFKAAEQSLKKYKPYYSKAYIATTIKYRFDESKSLRNYTPTDEELKLMLQAFLYSNDLKHAYQTALIGYNKHPNSYYWNQKMAEISRWSGRDSEALKYMKNMYAQQENSKLAKEIIDYGLSDYQYENIKDVVAKEAKANPTKKNIDKMIYVYSQIGEPQRAAQLLHQLYNYNPKNKGFLTKELQIYMNMGDLESASVLIDTIEIKNLYTYDNVKLISYYYYLKRNIQKAYATLTKVDLSNHYDAKIYQLLSDLGWYLQKYTPAAKASQKIIAHNKGRLVDYERVIYANKNTNYKLTNSMALQAYKKFGVSYLFYLFANQALQHKQTDELNATMLNIEASHSSLLQDANYWLIKAKLSMLQNNKPLAIEALKKARALAPQNMQLQFSAIDLYLKYGMLNQLNATLEQLSSNQNLAQSFYFPLASLYYSVHNVNLASYYMQELGEYDNPIIQTVAFKFLQADIYRAQNNENAFMSEIESINAILKQKADKNPEIKKTDKYLYDSLKTQMYILPVDTFERKLKKAKKHLTKAHYDDISYAWASKKNIPSKEYVIFLRTQTKEIWLKFANAMAEQNHSQIEDLLFNYLNAVPQNDATFAAQKDGQISLAQTMNYEALDKNSDNQNAYVSMLSLVKERSDRADIKVSYYNRDPLLRKYVSIDNSMYINDGIYFLSNVNYYLNSNQNTNILLSVPNDTLEFNLGAKKIFNKGEITLYGGYANSMKSYFVYSLAGKYKLDKYFTIKGALYKNKTADESTPLLLAGKKDMISLGLHYMLLNSTTLELTYQKSAYSSQDNKNLGDGAYGQAILGYQIRNGYPDMRISAFTDIGRYHENNTAKGDIAKVQNSQFQVLPNDFYNLGLNFAYGMQNSEIYTRVWRPYFEVSSYYNSDLGAYSYGFNAGYGGKVYSQDHLIVGTSYTNSVNGIGGSIFELFLKYQFLYTHR